MLKIPLNTIETLSTSTYELHTPENTVGTQHQWRRAMETDVVDNHDLLLGGLGRLLGYVLLYMKALVVLALAKAPHPTPTGHCLILWLAYPLFLADA